MTDQQQQQPPAATADEAIATSSPIIMRNFDDTNAGIYCGVGWSIAWQGSDGRGASTSDIIAATIGRIQFEQSRKELASDRNARALAALMEAKAVLEGKQTEADDGIPIIGD